jgi:hypothetical protein
MKKKAFIISQRRELALKLANVLVNLGLKILVNEQSFISAEKRLKISPPEVLIVVFPLAQSCVDDFINISLGGWEKDFLTAICS